MLAGIWLRIFIFPFLDPFNIDGLGHWEHIVFIKSHWSMPPAGLGHETWQPPLYYVIAAVMALIHEDPKFVQLLSLALSIGTVIVARKLILSGNIFESDEVKKCSFVLVCFLPQFIVYGLQISNDTLAMFLGFLAFHEVDLLRRFPDRAKLIKIAVILSLGLATKGQFLVISGILFPYSCYCCLRFQRPLWTNAAVACVLSGIVLLGGVVKYVENFKEYGHFFVSNLNFNPYWLKSNQGTYVGISSIIDVNLIKLIENPGVSDATKHSIPLLLYGSFWYAYMNDSNFRGDLLPFPKYIGRYLDLIGVMPAILLLLGICVAASPSSWIANANFDLELFRMCGVCAFLGTVALLSCTFTKFDAWSIFQARYLFPALIGGFVLCDLAIQRLQKRINPSALLRAWRYAFIAGASAYFAVEIVLLLRK